jgi:hypothetical protein
MVVTYLKVLARQLLLKTKEKHEKFRISCVQVGIQTGHFSMSDMLHLEPAFSIILCKTFVYKVPRLV